MSSISWKPEDSSASLSDQEERSLANSAKRAASVSSASLYDAKTVMLSVLGTYLNGIVLDHFIFGFDQKRRVCIMSSKLEELRQFILNDLHSGATIYESTGAYDNAPRKEIIVIVNKNEYSRLMSYV